MCGDLGLDICLDPEQGPLAFSPARNFLLQGELNSLELRRELGDRSFRRLALDSFFSELFVNLRELLVSALDEGVEFRPSALQGFVCLPAESDCLIQCGAGSGQVRMTLFELGFELGASLMQSLLRLFTPLLLLLQEPLHL